MQSFFKSLVSEIKHYHIYITKLYYKERFDFTALVKTRNDVLLLLC